ncbi:DUF3179 domain-containing protein [candidate division KSB1 bacterium]|nr:DUF3179 domain-containing protein [candidate division KSB1 bacterium]NIR72453.1 DUF3179 domain-containing protein [candidate division KSB1 bacterium]NIS25092.1 DUF3179 domain-containing protein [candidate division KSB1 bacterium]NIT72011.1 DUF3179 domain-containing protein [candidate division KSB1 bacterium]NIU25791.1 DUF3179 domain-containing protein [candidate division KSB1 bacterium]
MSKRILLLGLTYLALHGCQDNSLKSPATRTRVPNNDAPVSTSGWNIPEDEIISGGVPKDGIPSLFNPTKIAAEQANYLENEDLVVGIVVKGKPIAYPHTILDWHEVVNEEIHDKALTVSYCPLTGTAIVFDAKHLGRTLVFGVSGLLYNNNLIMFDRETDSHWPQMRLQCDEGPLKNTKQKVYPAIETSWGTWKKLFPNSEILSTKTGFPRPYDQPGSAYPDYNLLNSPPLFQQSFIDDRLPFKQRVHGVLVGEGPDNYQSKVYLIKENQAPRLIHDLVGDQAVLVIDSGEDNFVVSYFRTVDGTPLNFELEDGTRTFPFTFKDGETGTIWNVLGEGINGPLTGTKLKKTLSYNAYWFAWAAFYRGADIYDR